MQHKNWKWDSYDCYLKQTPNSELKPLKPTINITPNANIQTKIYIDVQKAFQFSQHQGWIWHKCWNLPNIYFKVQMKDLKTQKNMPPPPQLSVNIYVAKNTGMYNQKKIMQTIQLSGTTKIQLKLGQCTFSSLKIMETSHQHKNSYFNLIIILSSQRGIIGTFASSQIYVDSRKGQIFDSSILYMEYLKPFQVDIIQKKYIKKISRSLTKLHSQIGNTFDGFIEYYTAPNIRKKIKHPIFLLIKFSECFKLYINTRKIECKREQFLLIFQNIMLSNQGYLKTLSNLQDKSFILQFNSTKAKNSIPNLSKIFCFIQKIQNKQFCMIQNNIEMPNNFVDSSLLFNIEGLYKNNFIQLKSDFQKHLKQRMLNVHFQQQYELMKKNQNKSNKIKVQNIEIYQNQYDIQPQYYQSQNQQFDEQFVIATPKPLFEQKIKAENQQKRKYKKQRVQENFDFAQQQKKPKKRIKKLEKQKQELKKQEVKSQLIRNLIQPIIQLNPNKIQYTLQNIQHQIKQEPINMLYGNLSQNPMMNIYHKMNPINHIEKNDDQLEKCYSIMLSMSINNNPYNVTQ